jgi:hypothetical protein
MNEMCKLCSFVKKKFIPKQMTDVGYNTEQLYKCKNHINTVWNKERTNSV